MPAPRIAIRGHHSFDAAANFFVLWCDGATAATADSAPIFARDGDALDGDARDGPAWSGWRWGRTLGRRLGRRSGRRSGQ